MVITTDLRKQTVPLTGWILFKDRDLCPFEFNCVAGLFNWISKLNTHTINDAQVKHLSVCFTVEHRWDYPRFQLTFHDLVKQILKAQEPVQNETNNTVEFKLKDIYGQDYAWIFTFHKPSYGLDYLSFLGYYINTLYITDACYCFKTIAVLVENILCANWICLDHAIYVSLPRLCEFHFQSAVTILDTRTNTIFHVRQNLRQFNTNAQPPYTVYKVTRNTSVYFDLLNIQDVKPVAPLENLCLKNILYYQSIRWMPKITQDLFPTIKHPLIKHTNKLIKYIRASGVVLL